MILQLEAHFYEQSAGQSGAAGAMISQF